jgi:hypothetical protein
MIWRKRNKRGGQPRQAEERQMPTTLDTPVRETSPEDIRRAEQAANLAALSLHEARERAPRINDLADQIRRLNRENGFADMIRNAFGS